MPGPAPLELVRCRPADLTTAVLGEASVLLQDLVRDGAALGWVEPPSDAEVVAVLRGVATDGVRGDAALVTAWAADGLVGLGWWRRHDRPTHRPHADLEKLAVNPRHQGRGAGRALVADLVATARGAGVEVLTLDLRGDNVRAERLYASLGFARYGLLERFVAVRESRYDQVLMALDLRG